MNFSQIKKEKKKKRKQRKKFEPGEIFEIVVKGVRERGAFDESGNQTIDAMKAADSYNAKVTKYNQTKKRVSNLLEAKTNFQAV